MSTRIKDQALRFKDTTLNPQSVFSESVYDDERDAAVG